MEENTKMNISVVVPVHQAESTLKRCINSILSQTMIPSEIILVENSSTDNSAKICDQYAKAIAAIHTFHIPIGNVGRARNIGVCYSHGDYVVFVDSDDFLPSNALELLSESMTTDTDLVVGGFIRYELDGSETKYSPARKKLTALQWAEYCLEHRMKIDVGSVWGKMYRTEIAKKILFPENISFAEDNVFNMRYSILCKRIVICENITYCYCPRTNSLSSSIHHYINDLSFVQYERIKYVEQYDIKNGESRVFAYTVNMLMRSINELSIINKYSIFHEWVIRINKSKDILYAINNYNIQYCDYRLSYLFMYMIKLHSAKLLWYVCIVKNKIKRLQKRKKQ